MKILNLDEYKKAKETNEDELIKEYRQELGEDNGPKIKAVDDFMKKINEDKLRTNNGLNGKYDLLAELRAAVTEGADELDAMEEDNKKK